MHKKKIAIILVLVLFYSQNFIFNTSTQSELKTKDNPINKDFEINNFNIPRYDYSYYYLDNDTIYLLDSWNQKIGIYNLENESNPKQISDGHFFDIIPLNPDDDFNEIYIIKDFEKHLVNFNDSYLILKSYDVQNCSNIQQISSIPLKHI